jgi:N-acetylglucosamine-6-phosphate deacetylase
MVIRETEGLPTYMTIAPEMFDAESLEILVASHIKLAVGHSDATLFEATAAFNSGIPRVTHIFNAQSQWTSRALGIVGAAMDHSTVRASVVADGYHVDFAGIRLAKKLMGSRLFLITDAVTEDVSGPYYFSKKGGVKFTDENGTLSGSALTMIEAVKNCVDKVGIEVEEALRMASLYPAEVLALDDRLGTIEVGKEASFLWLSDDLRVLGVWLKGQSQL